jgi:hypothetical protein
MKVVVVFLKVYPIQKMKGGGGVLEGLSNSKNEGGGIFEGLSNSRNFKK